MRKALFLSIILFFLITPIASAHSWNIQEEIFYDILIDRFHVGDQTLSEQVRKDDPYAYHGGDFQGIIQKLDHIKQLGFTGIILSPVQKNAKDGYHGYWIEDFFEVNEEFGTKDDLHQLIDEAHKRDLKVIMEFVINYAAVSHPIVQDDEKRNYVQREAKYPIPDRKWLQEVVFFDHELPEVASYFQEVAEYWMDEFEFDGFRLHDADLTSETFLDHLTQGIKDKNDNFYLLASVANPESDIRRLQTMKTIDAVENYERFQKITETFQEIGKPLEPLYNSFDKSFAEKDILFVDHKDLARFSSLFAENGRGLIATWNLVFTYLYTAPGVPVIFQGTEIPMYGLKDHETQKLVRFNSPVPDLSEIHGRIAALKKQFPSFSKGNFELVASDGGMSVIKRSFEDETMYVAMNNDHVLRKITLTDLDEGLELRGFLADDLIRENKDGHYEIVLERETAEVYQLRENTGFNWIFMMPFIVIMTIFVSGMIYLSRKSKRQTNG